MSVRGCKPVYLTRNIFTDKLYKRGKFNKGWKERFFAVYKTEQKIEYYSSLHDRKQRKNICGSIDLSTVTKLQVITNSDAEFQRLSFNPLKDHIGYNEKAKSDKKYTFELITKNRTYIFAAYIRESLLKWLKYLQLCLYGKIVKQGWLQIQGQRNKKKWKNRYFVLDQFQHIKYYNDSKKTRCHGAIDCKIINKLNNGKMYGNGFEHTIELQTKSKIYIFAAICQDDRFEWMQYLNIMKRKDWQQKLAEMDSKSNDSQQNELAEFMIYKRPADDSSDDDDNQQTYYRINKRPRDDSSDEEDHKKEDLDNELENESDNINTEAKVTDKIIVREDKQHYKVLVRDSCKLNI